MGNNNHDEPTGNPGKPSADTLADEDELGMTPYPSPVYFVLGNFSPPCS